MYETKLTNPRKNKYHVIFQGKKSRGQNDKPRSRQRSINFMVYQSEP